MLPKVLLSLIAAACFESSNRNAEAFLVPFTGTAGFLDVASTPGSSSICIVGDLFRFGSSSSKSLDRRWLLGRISRRTSEFKPMFLSMSQGDNMQGSSNGGIDNTGAIPRKIWRIEKPGNLKDLKLCDDVLPPPASGEITVRVESIGLNFADVFTVLGMYDAAPRDQPVVPGLEFCGVIEAVGDRKLVTKARVSRSQDGKRYEVVERAEAAADAPRGLRVGDRVMGVTRFGAFATHLNVGAGFVRRAPDAWTAEQAAAFVVQALTAWYALVELGAARAGQAALVHSAAGGVGLHALQICEMRGVAAVAVVGSARKAAALAAAYGLPADRVIVRPDGAAEFAAAARAAAAAAGRPGGYDLVLDSLAGRYFRPGYEALAPGGRHILFGAATFTPRGDAGLSPWTWEFWARTVPQFLRRPRLDAQRMIGENKAVMGFNLIWLTDGRAEPRELGRLMDDMMRPAVRWRTPLVGRVFPFEEAPDALRYLKSGDSVGKVVLSMRPPPPPGPGAAAAGGSPAGA